MRGACTGLVGKYLSVKHVYEFELDHRFHFGVSMYHIVFPAYGKIVSEHFYVWSIGELCFLVQDATK